MTDPHPLRALLGQTGPLPTDMTRLVIDWTCTPKAVARGVADMVAYDLAEVISDTRALFGAGFCGTDGGALKLSKARPAPGRLVLTATGAVSPLAVFLLVRLVDAVHRTPPGAWQRLLYACDGNEDEARAAFSPRIPETDIAAIALQATGGAVPPGQPPFDPATPPPCPNLDPLTRTLVPLLQDGAAVVATLPATPRWSRKIEHGVLVLQGLGLFSPAGEPTPVEPEFILAGQTIEVQGWEDPPLFLAEILRLAAGTDPAAIQVAAA